MDPLPRPLAFFLLLVSGWVNRQQQAVIDYLLEENRILRAGTSPDGCVSPTTSDAASPSKVRYSAAAASWTSLAS
jgi:hypothetical protein